MVKFYIRSFVRFLVFIFCLLSYDQITNGKEARIQRRFMWKQMGMENLVSDMASRAFSMKHALSDSVVPNKLLDYLPSETTRIKYIIRNPTTNQPMKIIKIRPSKKILKIIPKPTITPESKPILLQKITVPTSPNADQIKKLELEQELISEGRLSFKSANDIFNNTPEMEMEKYTQQSKQETDEEYNSWSPLPDSNKISFFSTSKPKVMSPLHTSIMAEPIPIPEKLIYSTNIKDHDPNHNDTQLGNYNDKTFQTNSYEVTENIAEESIALPLINNAHISLRIGAAPPRYTLNQAREKDTNRAGNFAPIPENVSAEEPLNYPVNFLRRFQERSKPDSISPTNTPSIRTRQQKHTVDLIEDWLPSSGNITNNREILKFRTRWQGMHSHTKNTKWPMNPPDRTEKSTEIKYLVLSSTTTETTPLAEIKQYTLPTDDKLKRQLLTSPKATKHIDIREVRMHNRGRIKFGDKIFTD